MFFFKSPTPSLLFLFHASPSSPPPLLFSLVHTLAGRTNERTNGEKNRVRTRNRNNPPVVVRTLDNLITCLLWCSCFRFARTLQNANEKPAATASKWHFRFVHVIASPNLSRMLHTSEFECKNSLWAANRNILTCWLGTNLSYVSWLKPSRSVTQRLPACLLSAFRRGGYLGVSRVSRVKNFTE